MNPDFDQPVLRTAGQFGMAFGAALLGCLLIRSAHAQTPVATREPAPTVQSAPPAGSAGPLNLDADEVVKQANLEQPSSPAKQDVISGSPDPFEQSMLNSARQNKVHGMVEAGASAGTLPAQHGFKGENFTCSNGAVALADQVSSDTQVSLYAQSYNCK